MNVEMLDIESANIEPHGELADHNHALDSTEALQTLYEEQGYLLFRGVLDKASVKHALHRMMQVMARHGVVREGDEAPLWTGNPGPGKMEESPEFAGICRELIEHPHNLHFFERLLGERPSAVPIVQYRSYPPGGASGFVHQDGFYSPGIDGFRPVWIPLMTIDRDVGPLTLAPGVHKRGLLHNPAKPPVFPIPAGVIPADAWATTTYHAGDVLIIHPHTPHFGLANRSDRVRFSIDSRIQSAARPCVLLGDVIEAQPRALRLQTEDGERTVGVTEATYIRTGERRGARIPLDDFTANTPAGLRVVVAIDGNDATMIRRAAEG